MDRLMDVYEGREVARDKCQQSEVINHRCFASLYKVTCLILDPIARGFQTSHRLPPERIIAATSALPKSWWSSGPGPKDKGGRSGTREYALDISIVVGFVFNASTTIESQRPSLRRFFPAVNHINNAPDIATGHFSGSRVLFFQTGR